MPMVYGGMPPAGGPQMSLVRVPANLSPEQQQQWQMMGMMLPTSGYGTMRPGPSMRGGGMQGAYMPMGGQQAAAYGQPTNMYSAPGQAAGSVRPMPPRSGAPMSGVPVGGSFQPSA